MGRNQRVDDGGVDGNADAPTVTGPLPVAPAWAPPTWIPPTADYGAVPPSATAPVKKSAWTAGTIVALCLGAVLLITLPVVIVSRRSKVDTP